MSQFSFDFDQFVTDGGTQQDLDDLALRVKNRRWFDLSTPDPEFPGFTVRPEDQLPGRPMEGKIEIGTFFQRLSLFVTEGQQKGGGTNGLKIFNELKERKLPVFGPNVGQFLFEHEDLIPVDLREKVALVFWGKVYYRNSDGRRYVRCLICNGERWIWSYGWVDGGRWDANDRAMLLVR